MFRRSLVAAGMLLATLSWSSAQAAPGVATGNVNMRSGPGTAYTKLAVIPAGARVEVLGCPNWCEVAYSGRRGWVSSSYIRTGAYAPEPRRTYVPAPRYSYRTAMPAATYWRYGRPWWDDRHDAWYDGHAWWYDGRWYSRPRSYVRFEFGTRWPDRWDSDRPRCWLPEGCW